MQQPGISPSIETRLLGIETNLTGIWKEIGEMKESIGCLSGKLSGNPTRATNGQIIKALIYLGIVTVIVLGALIGIKIVPL